MLVWRFLRKIGKEEAGSGWSESGAPGAVVGRTFFSLSQDLGYTLERPWATVQPIGSWLVLRAKFAPKVTVLEAGVGGPTCPCPSQTLSHFMAAPSPVWPVSICEIGTQQGVARL